MDEICCFCSEPLLSNDHWDDDPSIDICKSCGQKVDDEKLAEKVEKKLGKQVSLTSGVSVSVDDLAEATKVDPTTKMQKAYVILSAEERAKGFVRPVRRSYRHLTCRGTTTMGQSLAETYAAKPTFYSGTFCSTCQDHFSVGPPPDGEFVWVDDETSYVGT